MAWRGRGPTVRGVAGSMLAIAASVSMLLWATNGFAVVTTDAARARAVQQTPMRVPDVAVHDQRGQWRQVLSDNRDRAIIVDFIYTRCVTTCSALGGVFQQLQRAILEQGLADQVRLLSISFDPEFDTPDRLARYARVMGARDDVWSFVSPIDAVARDSLLKLFGVQVVAEGDGQWQHNAALHVVSPDGWLVRIVEMDQPAEGLRAAVASWAGIARTADGASAIAP